MTIIAAAQSLGQQVANRLLQPPQPVPVSAPTVAGEPLLMPCPTCGAPDARWWWERPVQDQQPTKYTRVDCDACPAEVA